MVVWLLEFRWDYRWTYTEAKTDKELSDLAVGYMFFILSVLTYQNLYQSVIQGQQDVCTQSPGLDVTLKLGID